MAREPSYCRHKATGQAYVNLSGTVFYLGTYGSLESRERYASLKAEWLRNRHLPKFKKKSTSGPSLAELALAYLEHAKSYYRGSAEYRHMKRAIVPISELLSTLPSRSFGAGEFESIRDWWLGDKSRSRRYVNGQMRRLLRVIRWAVTKQLIPTENYTAMKCVEPLKYGRSTAKERNRVLPVDEALVKKTLPNLTPIQADIVRFQMATGCRPGEVVSIKPCLVDRSQKVWRIRLEEHKTAYREKERIIYVGPKGQKILAKYLLRGADQYCFSPIESEAWRRKEVHAKRVTPLSCGNKPGSRNLGRKPRKEPGPCYTSVTYYRFIYRACKRAKLTSWHPNQLRHLVGTQVRKHFGVEGSQAILGHSDIQTSQIYSEVCESRAMEIARKLG